MKVIGGLACRVRCVIAAVAYTQRTGKRLVVDWKKKDKAQKLGTFDVSLEELWEGPYEVTDTGKSWNGTYRTPRDELAAALDGDGDLRIRTDSALAFGRWNVPNLGYWFRRYMLPTEMLANRIVALTSNLPSPLIGVHVRDAKPGSQRAPDLDWYRRTIAERPAWPIRLCTESQRVADWFAAWYGDRVSISKREDDRPVGTYNRSGILHVAAELYLLADHCDWVIGSKRSTYSELVALMRGAVKIGSARTASAAAPNTRGGLYEDQAVPPDDSDLGVIGAKR